MHSPKCHHGTDRSHNSNVCRGCRTALRVYSSRVFKLYRLAGPIVKTCVIILTPITGENGKPAVKEVETCTVAIPPGPGGACATSTSGCGTTTSLAATVTSIIPGTSISASGLPTTTINPGLMVRLTDYPCIHSVWQP